MSKNRLLYGSKTAHLTGSGKTKYNNRGQSIRFSKRLHQLGYRVQHWKNISNRHVAVVVEDWQQQGLAVSTIKSYLSNVRQVCRAYGNDRIHKKNSEFGVRNRNYFKTNKNSAWSRLPCYRKSIAFRDRKVPKNWTPNERNARIGLAPWRSAKNKSKDRTSSWWPHLYICRHKRGPRQYPA